MANGRVCTGFSKPYVAVYTESAGTVTYSDGQILARGVDVNIEPSTPDENIFYADNVAAESAPGVFTGGSLTLTVDGLLDAAEMLLYGLPSAGTDGLVPYDDDMAIPYVGVGFIARYQSAGTVTYVPVILTKCRFKEHTVSAKTQEQDIDWQTEGLTADILRDDTTKHVWKYVGPGQTTEALAEAKIKTKFNIT